MVEKNWPTNELPGNSLLGESLTAVVTGREFRQLKEPLRKVSGKAFLNFTEMMTVLTDIESTRSTRVLLPTLGTILEMEESFLQRYWPLDETWDVHLTICRRELSNLNRAISVPAAAKKIISGLDGCVNVSQVSLSVKGGLKKRMSFWSQKKTNQEVNGELEM